MKNKYSEKQKEVLIREYKQSGMSVIRFGKKYGVSGTTISRWKKSYNKTDIDIPAVTDTEANFVEFKISNQGTKKEYVQSSQPSLVLACNGCALQIAYNFNQTTLRKVLEVVKEI